MEANNREMINSDKFEWKFFLRQLLICSGTWTCHFMIGLCFGLPTVMIPQLRKEANSTAAVSEEMASWLPAILSYSGVPWVVILPLMIIYIGQKFSYIIVCTLTLLGFILFFCSNNLTLIIISEILQGPLIAVPLTISLVIISEYASSKYRGIFLTLKSATFFWGILISNTIGTFFHWKKITLLGIICSLYCLATVVFWPESPYWLAAKGRLEDCSAAHRWLKGTDKTSERELQHLISSEQNSTRAKTRITGDSISGFFKIISSKQFCKPMLLSTLVLCLNSFSGKFICTIYAIDIIKKITNSESMAYKAMLILDSITVLSMYVGCVFVKLFRRRILLFMTSSIGIGFMFSISLYLYLIKLSLITENKYVSVILLSGYSISISCGPMLMAIAVSGELLPLHTRSIAMCFMALFFKIIDGIFIKVSPYFFKGLGLHGTFLFFGLLLFTCLIFSYFYLPETKDKTLQEITDSIMDKGSRNVDESIELMLSKNNEGKTWIVPAKKFNFP